MSARKAIAAFLGWLMVAFLGVAVVTIYVFDYFEGALGGRADNLFFSMAIYTALALVITAGFGAVLIWRGRAYFFQTRRVLGAAVIACGLLHAIAFAGPLFDYVGSSQVRIIVLAIYSGLVGALIAGGLIRSMRDTTYAA